MKKNPVKDYTLKADILLQSKIIEKMVEGVILAQSDSGNTRTIFE